MVKDSIVLRVAEATVAATGDKILPSVLRKTAGYLHIIQDDASILATLGWSRPYAFKFSYLPKITKNSDDAR